MITRLTWIAWVWALSLTLHSAIEPSPATVVSAPQTSPTNTHYVGNRAPLAPSSFLKLPLGSIKPQGWLKHQLELERDGMVGRLTEVSPWVDFAKSSWADREGRGRFGWEEMPYWLKGYGDLGYVLGDETVITAARKWIEAALASQREDGWFGPRELLTSLEGKPDMWPHMLMLNVLQSYFEFSGDPRVLEAMTRYFHWQHQLPESAFGVGYWPKIRMGDNLESVFWLYNLTGQSWLLDLARKMHNGMARWDEEVVNWHNVNIAQGFRAGTVFWPLSQEQKHWESAERNYLQVMSTYGQFPGGGFVGDENSRPGYVDPRGGIETCGIVEFMHSFEMLMRITGRPEWADRCEEITFNSFTASMTPDQKALHYVTCANQVQLDKQNKAPGIQNGGTMLSYSPYEVYRCCQHNVSHGWPYYAEESWLATPDNGLCASLYAPSSVTARVGDNAEVTLHEITDYPFSDTVRLNITAPQPARFPLYLRVPRWCESATLKINGEPAAITAPALFFVRVERLWKDGDLVEWSMPRKLTVQRWPANQNAASVSLGPLTFSLAIAERWESYGTRNPDWPEWEVYPQSAWNYGLALNSADPAGSFEIVEKSGPLPDQPFTPATVPLKLKVRGCRLDAWALDPQGLIEPLQPSPVTSGSPTESLTLIPMGAARLRLTMFPVIGSGPKARAWVAVPRPAIPPYRASASHCHDGDSVAALLDGLVPSSSHDQSQPRFTWWDHQGTKEWVQFELPEARSIHSVRVFWFDDTGTGRCRLPGSWRVLIQEGGAWKPVSNATVDALTIDRFNQQSFDPVKVTAVRIEAQLQPGFSAGILECKLD